MGSDCRCVLCGVGTSAGDGAGASALLCGVGVLLLGCAEVSPKSKDLHFEKTSENGCKICVSMGRLLYIVCTSAMAVCTLATAATKSGGRCSWDMLRM